MICDARSGVAICTDSMERNYLKKNSGDPFGQSPTRMFWAGIRCNPTIGVAPFSLFQAVNLYSCGFALILVSVKPWHIEVNHGYSLQ